MEHYSLLSLVINPDFVQCSFTFTPLSFIQSHLRHLFVLYLNVFQIQNFPCCCCCLHETAAFQPLSSLHVTPWWLMPPSGATEELQACSRWSVSTIYLCFFQSYNRHLFHFCSLPVIFSLFFPYFYTPEFTILKHEANVKGELKSFSRLVTGCKKIFIQSGICRLTEDDDEEDNGYVVYEDELSHICLCQTS